MVPYNNGRHGTVRCEEGKDVVQVRPMQAILSDGMAVLLYMCANFNFHRSVPCRCPLSYDLSASVRKRILPNLKEVLGITSCMVYSALRLALRVCPNAAIYRTSWFCFLVHSSSCCCCGHHLFCRFSVLPLLSYYHSSTAITTLEGCRGFWLVL